MKERLTNFTFDHNIFTLYCNIPLHAMISYRQVRLETVKYELILAPAKSPKIIIYNVVSYFNKTILK